MARVATSDPMPGFRTCGRPRIASPDYGDAVRAEDCPAYLESQPCEIVEEVTEWTFRDRGAATTPGMNVDGVESSSVRYLPADGDWSCESCGFEMCGFSPLPRPQYEHMSEQDPNELRRRSLRQDKNAEQQLKVAERQADAMEKLVAQGDQAAVIAQLQQQLADLNARLDEKPKPRPRTPA